MKTLIRDTNGVDYTLTSKCFEETFGGAYFNLTAFNLKEKTVVVRVRGNNFRAAFSIGYDNGSRNRTIGCRTFTPTEFAKIARAARWAQKNTLAMAASAKRRARR